MDPDACYARITDAWRDRDYEELKWACIDLSRWVEFMGNMPTAVFGRDTPKRRRADDAGLPFREFLRVQLNRIATRCNRVLRKQARA